jgi:hypothetical protein
MQSYWGLFGGVNVPMPGWVYAVLNWLAALSVIGTAVTLALKTGRDRFSLGAWMPTLLSLAWIVAVVAPLALSWARITWSSQGRLVFSAIMAISLWFMAGLGGWLPERWGKVTTGAVISFMAALTAVAPWAWIAPSYRVPEQITNVPAGQTVYDFVPPGTQVPTMRLLAYQLNSAETEPGGAVRLTLYWESLALMDRNWSIFIHLEDRAGLLAGQRDTYPGVGLIATSDLNVGRRWADSYVVPVSESAYAPEELEVKIGLYDYATCPVCERMTLAGGGDSVTLGQVSLLARAGDSEVPNAVAFNFGDELELIGYRLDSRQASRGETIRLTLYWRGLRPMEHNYTISTQVLGPENRIYGQKDSWPLDGALPTIAWTAGAIIEDDCTLALVPDTPPGIYDIQIVVYWADEAGSIKRLQRITEDGRLVDDFVLLTEIRVTE